MRNLVVFDIETTGLNKLKDQIIQFSALKVNQETNDVIDILDLYIQPHQPYIISIGAFFKHGIKPEFLSDKPFFEDVAQQILNFIKDCDILTYNGLSFDLSFLIHELNKYGFDYDTSNINCYDSFLIEKRIHGLTLSDVYKRYTGISMEDSSLTAHNALSDVKATLTIFYNQKNEYPNEVKPENVYGEDNVIVEKEFLRKIVPCFNIGKYKGLSVEYVAKIDQSYLNWCISDKSGFLNKTKNFIKQYIIDKHLNN